MNVTDDDDRYHPIDRIIAQLGEFLNRSSRRVRDNRKDASWKSLMTTATRENRAQPESVNESALPDNRFIRDRFVNEPFTLDLPQFRGKPFSRAAIFHRRPGDRYLPR